MSPRLARHLALAFRAILATAASGALSVAASQPADSLAAAEPQFNRIDSTLRQARTLMGDLEYEEVIRVLQPLLDAARMDPDRLRDIYLLLIEAHVYSGNRSASGSKEQQLWYEEARKLVRDCLATPGLHRTRPEPPESYPLEMLQLFEEIRREVLGSFEITELVPPEAEVLLDGQVLERHADGTWREFDLPVGAHVLVIRHDGYEVLTDDLQVDPGMHVARSYALEKHRGFGWYATRVGVPVAAAVGAVAVGLTASGDDEATRSLLPGPPPPPAGK